LHWLFEVDLKDAHFLSLGNLALNDGGVIRTDLGTADHQGGGSDSAQKQSQAQERIDGVSYRQRFHIAPYPAKRAFLLGNYGILKGPSR